MDVFPERVQAVLGMHQQTVLFGIRVRTTYGSVNITIRMIIGTVPNIATLPDKGSITLRLKSADSLEDIPAT